MNAVLVLKQAFHACLMMYFVNGKELRLLGLQPMGGLIWPGGPACIAPVHMAIDDVHAYSGLLDEYTLKYDFVDSQVM